MLALFLLASFPAFVPGAQIPAQESAEASNSAPTRGLPVDLRRWLDEVATLLARGELDGARSHLAALVEGEVYAALLAGEDEVVLAGLDKIDVVAKSLSVHRVQRSVREERVRRLSASLDEDHPDLLSAKQNLAVTRGALGDLLGALELQEHVHAARERLLPADHPHLLNAKQNLAATRYQLGDLTGRARALRARACGLRERLLTGGSPGPARRQAEPGRHALGSWAIIAGAHELLEHVHAALGAAACRRTTPTCSCREAEPGRHRLQRWGISWARSELLGGTCTRRASGCLPADHPDLLRAKQNLAATRG